MAYVTWEYYSSLYDVISEADFEAAETKAETEVKRVIGLVHWLDLPSEEDLEDYFYADQFKDCICRVMNYQKQVGSKAGKGVASVSNDGYSESYVLQTASQASEELKVNIRDWLSGTGLVRAY